MSAHVLDISSSSGRGRQRAEIGTVRRMLGQRDSAGDAGNPRVLAETATMTVSFSKKLRR